MAQSLESQLQKEQAAFKEACQVITEFQQRLTGKYLDSDQTEAKVLEWEEFLRSRQ